MYVNTLVRCIFSYIDRFYVPKNKERSGAVLLLGLDTTSIEYDEHLVSWKIMQHFHNTIALTDAPLSSYVLGSHEWLIENDNVDCSISLQVVGKENIHAVMDTALGKLSKLASNSNIYEC